MKNLNQKETNAWMSLVRAEQILIDKIEEELKSKGYPPLNWYDVLWALENSSEGRLRLNDVGNIVLLNKYNVTRLVNRLVSKGLVSKEHCSQDGRGIFACITKEGKKIRKDMWDVYRRVLKESFSSNYTEEELTQLAELMQKIIKPTQNINKK